jgi:hypothetical protein
MQKKLANDVQMKTEAKAYNFLVLGIRGGDQILIFKT